MSIINCPHCGKPITDKASTCIHCGKPLVEDVPVRRLTNYAELSKERAKELNKEFSSACPKCGGIYKKIMFFTRLLLVCVFSVVLLCIIFSLVVLLNHISIGEEEFIKSIVFLGIILILAIVCVLIIRYYNKQMVYYHKYFQWWLLNKYQIEYTIDYSKIIPTQKELFDNIKVDESYFIK